MITKPLRARSYIFGSNLVLTRAIGCIFQGYSIEILVKKVYDNTGGTNSGISFGILWKILIPLMSETSIFSRMGDRM
jgi:hypothetical protein